LKPVVFLVGAAGFESLKTLRQTQQNQRVRASKPHFADVTPTAKMRKFCKKIHPKTGETLKTKGFDYTLKATTISRHSTDGHNAEIFINKKKLA
jgi:hypothetical protein